MNGTFNAWHEFKGVEMFSLEGELLVVLFFFDQLIKIVFCNPLKNHLSDSEILSGGGGCKIKAKPPQMPEPSGKPPQRNPDSYPIFVVLKKDYGGLNEIPAGPI
jgi:hypothetical protein